MVRLWQRAKNWRAPRPLRVDRRTAKWGAIVGVPVALVALFLVFFEWNMLRGPLANYLSSKTGRAVHIDGNLDVDLGWSPIVKIGGLRISNPEWVTQDPDMAVVDRVAVQFKLLPLFIGRVILPSVDIDRPQVGLIRQETGRANWVFGRDDSEPTKLPVINSLRIDDGKLHIIDEERKLVFEGTVNSREGAAQRDGRAFFLEGKGALNRRPFLMEVEGDSLLNVSPNRPYAFEATIREGATHIVMNGAIMRPFDFGGIEGRLALNGNDVADLFYLTGLALPNTPPYRIAGMLRRNGEHYAFRNFSGKVGDSDMQGTLTVDASGERPFLKGAIKSRRLDFDDLGAVLGAAPATGAGETASPGQKQIAAELAAEQRLLPDAPLQVERVRAMDAEVRYTADSVNARGLPLTRVTVGVDLKNGVLNLNPVSLTLRQGTISGKARINAQKDVPVSDIDILLNNARLEQFFAANGADAAAEGPFEARLRLHGSGLSVHKTLASADGNIAFAVPNGRMRRLFAELLGINVASALGLFISDDESETELRCAVADFTVQKGIMSAQTVVLDTGPVLAKGSGTINLNTETMNLRLEGEPKKFELIRLMAPITLTGKLRASAVGIEPGKAIAQGVIGGALATLVSPLVAALPFLAPGMADDADCTSLLAQVRREGVPVAANAGPREERGSVER